MGHFGNIKKMIDVGMASWTEAAQHGLAHVKTARSIGNRLETPGGHQFINMVSCSYLGLNRHPKLIEGAIRAIREEGMMSTSISRTRVAPAMADEVEALMSEVFGAEAVLAISCAAASAGVLPILASGHMTDGVKPFMIFDKNCHFSMNALKAACGDETQVVTGAHNDVGFIEEMCKTHPVVAYVADGAYSMGGAAPVKELLALQEKYGLFLYLDDSHSISAVGKRGVGLARSQMDTLSKRTIIVASLGKAFGATGGVILLGDPEHRKLLEYFGGPLGWSQMVNAAGLGAIRASAEIHLTDELDTLQARLGSIMRYFDTIIPTENAGNGLPVRVIPLGEPSRAIEVSAKVFERGFYTSAVFFPIVAQGKAGLRVMGRADLDESDLENLCSAISEFVAA
ncbi:aminotransferase class I/II-fold pyridoxal phosphate-dependent enzyme [Allosphingosinicella flava]|uniref:Aminotransferase class I/II-fold pyridoxal phosphate-dependent enzyme n=1 Tax=Allosphingosinicella flava TaxID=2771430 RepID=A0A7T2GI21_9SPHN|nr:aminotransferase class I/II-fold pyridoxal phosphate-dependent enzyme [Sphingosinicella flava]QPQ54244.1 aminotransferase class I/II-fold pyridoxal phosphate-dependent enzyme [Sphingosinicella flava]